MSSALDAFTCTIGVDALSSHTNRANCAKNHFISLFFHPMTMATAEREKTAKAVKKPKGEKDRIDDIIGEDGNMSTAHKAQKSFEVLIKLKKEAKVISDMFVELYQAQPAYTKAASEMQKQRAIVVSEKSKVDDRDPENRDKLKELKGDILEARRELKDLIVVDFKERVLKNETTQLSLFRNEESGLKIEYIPEISVNLKAKEAEAIDADTGQKVTRDPKDFDDLPLSNDDVD